MSLPAKQKALSLELSRELRKHKLSSTQARLDLLRLLRESKKPLSIVELAKALKKNCPDPTTLYRNIRSLENVSLIESVDLGDRVARFEFRKNKTGHHHHHVTCRTCGKVECVPLCLQDSLIKAVEGMGFRQVKHQLSFQALCLPCANSIERL